ncbi:MAG TPA: molybdate ABC transporter permease subunit [Gammaproteobacteria bacterium]|nr:molybdate ABC transporter permease subunit [Gammaproteobacteria bacterium]
MTGLTPVEVEALRLSLKVGLWSVALSLPVAVPTAVLLARREFPGKQLLNAVVYLPLILPPVATGYLLLLMFGRRGPVGSWLEEHFGLVLAFRWTGAAVAAAVMGFPLMVRAICLSVEAIDRRVEVAAATLGASRPWIFVSVTLPLAVPGIIAGTILSFARGVGEFGATITFVSNIPGETRTLPIAIHAFLQTPGGEAAALRLTVLAIVLSLAAIVASEILARRLQRRLHGA